MSAISNTSYILPPRRPWDPSRFAHQDARNALQQDLPPDDAQDDWVEGKVVKGHPNICPLLDFFENNHYYYLVLPSSTPETKPGQPAGPSDLFDLVENYPQGLPPPMIRSYLGQIADALSFLHAHGIGMSASDPPPLSTSDLETQSTATSRMRTSSLARRASASSLTLAALDL